MDNSTCILYFGRSARAELKHKQLAVSHSANLQLITKLQKHTISEIKRTRLPFVIHKENDQIGKSFGEKLTNSINSCFQSYENVIVVGYDCPHLNCGDLREASQTLSTGVNVVGADENGGAYLIGLTKKRWNPACFQELSWKSENLYSDLISIYFEKVVVYLHKSKIDINSSKDLLSLIASSYLKGYILDLLSVVTLVVKRFFSFFSGNKHYLFRDLQFRGPPVI